MTDAKTVKLTGTIGNVFAHRFTVETSDGQTVLADLGPKGAEAFRLSPGLLVTAQGEMKPSELKVTLIETAGRPAVAIEHKGKHAEDPGAIETVIIAVAAAGYTAIGTPHRKPKHFEVRAAKGSETFYLHVELDGRIKKAKPVAVPSAAA